MQARTYDIPGVGRAATTQVHVDTEPGFVAEQLHAGNAIVLLDPALLANPGVRRLLAVSDPTILVVLLDSSEATKSIETLQRFNIDVLDTKSAGWVIGGGSLINFAYYAFARRREADPGFRVVCLPSNTMAMCDVAIGSLGLLNDDHSGRKNAVRRTCDPDDIFLCRWLLATGDLAMQQEGIIEVVKHALFQDPASLPQLAQTFCADVPDIDDLFECAVAGLVLKAGVMRVLARDPRHVAARVLSYGHLHATALEEALSFEPRHAWAVLFGLLVDLHLEGLDHPRDVLISQVTRWSRGQDFGAFWQPETVASVVDKLRGAALTVLSPRRTLRAPATTLDELDTTDLRLLSIDAIEHAIVEVGGLLAGDAEAR
ncbi:3-dehydroquinate synthase family protein [Aquabacterium sp.]|uniref:3-dehydroquinate synthase family protein n=1 Tax=Aquabacterium sp. TaxID=1872578 RepID=UPI003D6D004F